MKKGKEIKCCAHTKTDSMSTAVPAHLGRPTALSWLFLPSFVSTYCFFFFFLSDQIHIGGQPEQYATQCRATGGRPLDGIRNLSAGLLTSRLPDGTAGPSLTSRAQQPLPWTPRDHPSVYTKTCPDPPAVRLIPSSSIIRIPSSP